MIKMWPTMTSCKLGTLPQQRSNGAPQVTVHNGNSLRQCAEWHRMLASQTACTKHMKRAICPALCLAQTRMPKGLSVNLSNALNSCSDVLLHLAQHIGLACSSTHKQRCSLLSYVAPCQHRSHVPCQSSASRF